MTLTHYRSVRDGQRPPRFMQARALLVSADADTDLWKRHTTILGGLTEQTSEHLLLPSFSSSLLDLKITLAEKMLDACDLCPHHCLVDRNHGQTGFCGVADRTAVHWEGILHGEEIEVVPSHEVFLSGCTMRCAFCYSHEHITRPMSGLPMAPTELAACAGARRAEGATNLNLVGGDPIVHVANILKTLRLLTDPIPIVWNSNMYATARTMELLDGVVDLFLGDIHFGNDRCARRLGRIPDYLPSVQAAFAAAVASGASVIIRHLVMPGHNACCARPAMEWAAKSFPDVPFHLMFQYLPDYRAENDRVLGRPLNRQERDEALRMAREIGVNLYEERGEVSALGSAFGASPVAPIGETVDIVIHDDGRVGFTRLLEDLLPIASALAGDDDRRVSARFSER